MEDLIEKIGWKKMSIFLIGVSIFGMIYVFISLLNMDKVQKDKFEKESEAVITSSPSKTKDSDDNEKNSEWLKAPFENYETSFYKVSYPSNYTPTVMTPPQGSLSYVKFMNSSDNSVAEILVVNAGENSISSMAKPYIDAGFEPETIPLPIGEAIEYWGVSQSSPPLREKVVFVTKGNVIIKTLISYSAEEPSIEIVRNLTKMLTTLR